MGLEMEECKANIGIVCVVLGLISAVLYVSAYHMSATRAKYEINQRIAAAYDVDYKSVSELDKRVDFYVYHPAKLGAKSGCYYVVDGVEYKGCESDINEMIQTYIFKYD